jgi:hypothetical protein
MHSLSTEAGSTFAELASAIANIGPGTKAARRSGMQTISSNELEHVIGGAGGAILGGLGQAMGGAGGLMGGIGGLLGGIGQLKVAKAQAAAIEAQTAAGGAPQQPQAA